MYRSLLASLNTFAAHTGFKRETRVCTREEEERAIRITERGPLERTASVIHQRITY